MLFLFFKVSKSNAFSSGRVYGVSALFNTILQTSYCTDQLQMRIKYESSSPKRCPGSLGNGSVFYDQPIVSELNVTNPFPSGSILLAFCVQQLCVSIHCLFIRACFPVVRFAIIILFALHWSPIETDRNKFKTFDIHTEWRGAAWSAMERVERCGALWSAVERRGAPWSTVECCGARGALWSAVEHAASRSLS